MDVSPEQLRAACEVIEPLVAGVDGDTWAAPTPCEGWTVRELVNHVTVGNLIFAGVLEERGTVPDLREALAGDQLGADAGAAFRASADAVVAAFSRPGVMDRTVTVMFGTVPAGVALHLRVTEVLVHGWDLARALGRSVTFDDAVVEQEIAFSRTLLPRVPPERAVFAPSEPVGQDAPPLDRLVALLGRRP